MPLENGTTLGPYQIIAAIGSGGMGEVYRARDARLARDVAVKVLPANFAADDERLRRFKAEARAAGTLNHPNIIAIYDIGFHEGTPYLVMELLDGAPLSQHLNGTGVPPARVLEMAIQLASGLASAHARNVAHRDLKPDNVFVTTDGRIKILDFGLAKQFPGFALDAETAIVNGASPGGTEAGVILGTVGYMSPEQARGESADQRSDIFSFGCVLYEMLCGRRAFGGASAIETLNAILTAQPAPLSAAAGTIPAAIEPVLKRCLEKRSLDRFASGQELVSALQACLQPASGVSSASTVLLKSIVVLPFTDLSPGGDSEYFSDGLTEELIGDLSRVGSLRVVSRTTAMALKGTGKDVRTLAAELSVRYVLEGSVRRAVNNLRISAQLIDASTDATVWGERFNGTLDDVFEIQEKVSRAITDALKVTLTESEDRRMAQRPTVSIQAYDCYLKARRAIATFEPTALADAERLLLEGLAVGGDNALLLAGLARVHFEHVDLGMQGAEGLDEAEAFARRALALDSENAPAHLVLGLVLHFHGHMADAITSIKRALAIDPNDVDALGWLAYFYAWTLGRPDQSFPLLRRLLAIDPQNPAGYLYWAIADFAAGRFDAAVACSREHFTALEVPLFRYMNGLALAGAGQREEALRVFEPVEPQEAFDPWWQTAMFLRFALQGRKDRLPEALRPELVRLGEVDACNGSLFGWFYAILGERELALDWLERAVSRGFFNYPWLHTHCPYIEELRRLPRFERLLERAKRQWEDFDA
jgi:serine/threonine protein kinase/tetratricopeptide (TPR) repeat protein